MKLSGKWSIDIMIQDNNGVINYYLIDMAPAHRSVYWDSNRCN